jgi:twitching motility protein PilJ
LLLFIALAFYAINQVRVGGPVYDEIKANQDLRADILPPPLYSVDAFAAANAAFVAASSSDFALRDKKLEEVARGRSTFKKQVEYWKTNIHQDTMGGAFQAVIKSNENFYRIYNKDYVPAIKLGAIAAAKPLADLTAAYDVNRQTVSTMVAELDKQSSKTQASADTLLKTVLTALAVLGLLILRLFGCLDRVKQNRLMRRLSA